MANSAEDDMLSPGLKFNPSDDDIVGFFLRRAVMGVSLPTIAFRFIRYVELYGDKPPWVLFPDFPETREFFVVSSLKKLTKGRSQRRSGGGTWKRQSVRKEIATEGVVGEKYTLSFLIDEQNVEGKKKGSSTGWNMTEYRLLRGHGVDVDCKKAEETVFCKIVYSGKESFDSCSSVLVCRRRGRRGRNDRDDHGEVIDGQIEGVAAGNKKARVSCSSITISVAPPPPGGGASAAEDAEMGDDDDAFMTYLEGQLETDDAVVVESQSDEEEIAAAVDGNKIDGVFLEKEEDAAETQLEEQYQAADVLVETQLDEEHQAADVSNTIVVVVDDDDDGYLDLIDFDVSLFDPNEEDEPAVGIFPISEDETANNAEMVTGGGSSRSDETAPVSEEPARAQLVHHAAADTYWTELIVFPNH